jgi:ribonucleotide reductase alpha subunit
MKIGIWAFALLAGAAVSGVAASQTTSTTCSGFGHTTNCTTTTAPDFSRLFADSAAKREQEDAARHRNEDSRMAAVERLAAKQSQSERFKRIGTLIAEGHCAEAKEASLRDGDLDLAAKV